MPRRPRNELPSGFFHITSRGVDSSFIFRDDNDRHRFVLLLQQVTALWGWRVLAWCLMGTHYHLVVESRREQMSLAVHRLNCLHAMGFNRRYERRGHLFENRYSAWVIEDDEHLGATIEYVLENPVRAGLCTDPRDWLWNWAEAVTPADLVAPVTAALAVAEGLSLGRGPKGHGEPGLGLRREEDDVHLAGAVDADGELLLDVGAPARAGDDRERARQIAAERREELVEAGKDRSSRSSVTWTAGQQRPRARLVRRGGEHDAARVGEPVERASRRPAPSIDGGLAAVDVRARRARRSRPTPRRGSSAVAVPSARAAAAPARTPTPGPGPTSPASGCPSRASRRREPVPRTATTTRATRA